MIWMEERLPCDKHEEQIKTLFKRVDGMENMRNLLYSLDKNSALQTQLLESVVEHNNKQDIRADKQDQVTAEQQQINMKINENLTELAEGQRALNKRVGKLEERVDTNENKHLIDSRDIDKEKKIGLLKKYGEPTVIIVAIGTILLKLIKIFKG